MGGNSWIENVRPMFQRLVASLFLRRAKRPRFAALCCALLLALLHRLNHSLLAEPSRTKLQKLPLQPFKAVHRVLRYTLRLEKHAKAVFYPTYILGGSPVVATPPPPPKQWKYFYFEGRFGSRMFTESKRTVSRQVYLICAVMETMIFAYLFYL
jgi:hypothetical protein